MGGSFSLIRTILDEKTGRKFLVGAILGLSFSIAIILAGMGLMDNYVKGLKLTLRKSTGDIIMASYEGPFVLDQKIYEGFREYKVKEISPYLQTQGFLVANEISKGALIKGVSIKSYNEVTHLELSLNENEMAIGKVLAQELGLNIGDTVALVLSGKGRTPHIRSVKAAQIMNHGLYEKDARFAYMREEDLRPLLGASREVTAVTFNIPYDRKEDLIETISNFRINISGAFDENFYFKPFWEGFDGLMRAVKVEKFMIGLILQLIVLLSIFNISAVIIYINEKKSSEIFLFKALGLSQKKLMSLWFFILGGIWFFSCLLSFFILQLFDLILMNSNFLELPPEVYRLEQKIHLIPEWGDFVFVFFLAFLWIFIMAWIVMLKVKKSSVLSGLRKEFS